jgi:hypothetical protein
VPDSDLVVMTDDISQQTFKWLRESGANVIPASYSLLKLGRVRQRFVRHLATDLATQAYCAWIRLISVKGDTRPQRVREAMLDLLSARFGDYLRFLLLYANDYTSVLMVDCRDAIFQGSPFPCHGLHAFAEKNLIGESISARNWFRMTYGLKAWRRITDRPFLNAGTILGDIASVSDFLQKMIQECRKRQPNMGEDQAVYNHVIYNQLPSTEIHDYGQGDAINLHAIPEHSLRVINEQLVDSNGRPIPVVHQYDRVPGLSQKLAATKRNSNAIFSDTVL